MNWLDATFVLTALFVSVCSVATLLLWFGECSPRAHKPDEPGSPRAPSRVTPEQPEILRGAKLIMAETAIACGGEYAQHGIVDEYYQLGDGRLLLVDTKSRANNAVYEADRAQLSSYGYILRALGRQVVPWAFVCLVLPGGEISFRRQTLMPDAEVERLVRRVREIRAGTGQCASKRDEPARCRNCSQRQDCGSSQIPDGSMRHASPNHSPYGDRQVSRLDRPESP